MAFCEHDSGVYLINCVFVLHVRLAVSTALSLSLIHIHFFFLLDKYLHRIVAICLLKLPSINYQSLFFVLYFISFIVSRVDWLTVWQQHYLA